MNAEPIRRRGIMFVLSSPSGAGKSSIARGLMESESNLVMSISVTTRTKRGTEINGEDYIFVDRATFDRMAERGELLEQAEVFGHRSGTPRGPVEAALAAGRDVLFDIDWQGSQQLAGAAPGDVVRLFVLPPSTRALASRLESRAQDSRDVVAARMAKAADEMSHYVEYDYIIVNEALDRSVSTAHAILGAERARRERLIGLAEFVRELREG